jgi:hypothetical protein
MKNWSLVPDGRLTPRRTGRLSVSRNVTSTLTSTAGVRRQRINSIYCAQLRRFHLMTETQFSLQNAMFEIKYSMMDDVGNCDSYLIVIVSLRHMICLHLSWSMPTFLFHVIEIGKKPWFYSYVKSLVQIVLKA